MNEPHGGNLYRPHPLLKDHGLFWRCKHGLTGYADGFRWVGFWRCWLTKWRR